MKRSKEHHLQCSLGLLAGRRVIHNKLGSEESQSTCRGVNVREWESTCRPVYIVCIRGVNAHR